MFSQGIWATLPKASKAIFPVLSCFRDGKTGVAFPSEQTVAILSGRTDKVVRMGIKGLEGFPGVQMERYLTARGRWSRRFFITAPPQEKGRAFPFFKAVVTGGYWLFLTPTAQALYPVMRYFSFYEFWSAEERDDFDEQFLNRAFEYCEAETVVMAEHAGIDRRSMGPALKSLEQQCLVEPEEDRWKVWLRPSKFHVSLQLNGWTAMKYRHLLDGKKLPVNDGKKLPSDGK